MRETFSHAKLKNGETGRLFCITAPDTRDSPFVLEHKQGLWQWQLERALAGPLDSLVTRLYQAELAGEVAANICTFESGPVGILGHVFTRPEHRRKGLCNLLMECVVEDFRHRGGAFMTLGTGFDSAPFHIYRSFGFREVESGSGAMRLDASAEFVCRALAPGEMRARPMRWDDWPWLNVLSFGTTDPTFRSACYRVVGRANLERAGLEILHDCITDHRCRAWVLENTETRAVLGLATIAPDATWSAVRTMDLWAPGGGEAAEILLAAVELPDGKVTCYQESGPASCGAHLKRRGFGEEGLLRQQVHHAEKRLDIQIWGRGD